MWPPTDLTLRGSRMNVSRRECKRVDYRLSECLSLEHVFNGKHTRDGPTLINPHHAPAPKQVAPILIIDGFLSSKLNLERPALCISYLVEMSLIGWNGDWGGCSVPLIPSCNSIYVHFFSYKFLILSVLYALHAYTLPSFLLWKM